MDDEKQLFKSFSSLNLCDMDFSELEDVTISLTKKFIQNLTNLKNGKIEVEKFNETSLNCIKHLKISCTKGPSFQNLIVNTNGMLESLKEILQHNDQYDAEVRLKSFQLLANMCVKNEKSQKRIWREESDLIVEKLKSADNHYSNVAAMIVYNIILTAEKDVDLHSILSIALDHYDNFLKNKATSIADFVHILLDYFLCSCEEIVDLYEKSSPEEQKVFLFYVNDHVENESNEAIHITLLKHITMEFKKKSDCILKTVTTYVESLDPETVVTLLDVISSATAQEKYLFVLKDDASLFLNVGCLLQTLHKVGKNSTNAFTPIQKLEALTPNSSESAAYEKEISFQFKTKLVRSLANLSHRNKKNQELAREMEIMQSIFECTNADARNPLIKEWSILAIRNLCEDNEENQEMIKNLTRVGDVSNPVLKEFGLDDGVLRIAKT